MRRPVLGTCEHDALSVCNTGLVRERPVPEAPPAATSVVDSAIRLFAELFVVQDVPSASRVVTEVLESVRSAKLDKNAGRKAAVLMNVSVAFVLSLRLATVNSSRRGKDIFGDARIVATLSSFLKVRSIVVVESLCSYQQPSAGYPR
jgi:HEAT repeat-containing protein 5